MDPFRMYQSAHRTFWSYFSIIHQLHSPYECVASSHSASSLPNITVRFPCQLFPRLFRCTSMEAAEVCHRWRCRRREEFCVWRDAQRKKRVGCRDVYKEERTVLRVHSSLRLTYSVISQPLIGKEDLSSHQAEPSGLIIKQLSLIAFHF